MRPYRPIVALVASLLTLAASAQEATEPTTTATRRIETVMGPADVLHDRPDAEQARYTLWVAYPDHGGDYLDHRQYLADLQSRYGAKGVAVGVIMPAPSAKAIAADKPSFLVAAMRADEAPGLTRRGGLGNAYSFLCRGTSAEALVGWQSLDGIVDLLDNHVDGAGNKEAAQIQQLLQSLVGGIADGGEFGEQVAQCLQALPRSGRAHAAAVLYQWWCKGDLVAAGKAIEAGINALASDAVPTAVFADLVLRGDRTDPAIARSLAMAMAPVAAAAPEGVFTQLVYLRALLHAGQDRIAGRIAATLPKRLQGRPRDQLIFAETLMDAETPAVYRDAAERALAAAKGDNELQRWLFCARHKVLTRCGDPDAAEKLMADYRKSDVGRVDLNNDAWYLIVQPATMGRFPTLALAQAATLEQQEGAGLSYGNKDTVALAYFVNGNFAKAAELQAEATKAARDDPIYVGRLTRYQATIAAEARRAAARQAGKTTGNGR